MNKPVKKAKITPNIGPKALWEDRTPVPNTLYVTKYEDNPPEYSVREEKSDVEDFVSGDSGTVVATYKLVEVRVLKVEVKKRYATLYKAGKG